MNQKPYITASCLYDYIECPHKVWRDIYGPQEEKIQETNPFVELLWKKGVQHEEKLISTLGDFLDLSVGNHEERFQKTIQAMKEKKALIYQGVLISGNLKGIPDLLQLMPDGSYMPLDIKSGMGVEGGNDENSNEKLKDTYAVQLALYVDILQKLNLKKDFMALVWDGKSNKVEYDLSLSKGKKDKQTWWEFYKKLKEEVEALLNNVFQNKPASGGKCKLCPWYNSCQKWVEETNDLTNIFFLGRSKRDRLNEDIFIKNLDQLLELDVEEVMKEKNKENKNGNKDFLSGIGESTLNTIAKRAKVFHQTKKPIAYKKIQFPKTKYELFFDIETDPTQDFVYLHGIWERCGDKQEFKYFLAEELTPEKEKKAWADFWQYINSLPQDDFSVYYYSPYEKTTYKAMQKKYPDVISEEKLDKFFENSNVIDIYTEEIMPKTDWPLGSYSIKYIARYLGFEWEDKTPSGALSIEWFNEYIKTKEDDILQRILKYNRDDCKATMIVKDGLEALSE